MTQTIVWPTMLVAFGIVWYLCYKYFAEDEKKENEYYGRRDYEEQERKHL